MTWLERARNGQTPTFEWHARRRDGSLFWLEISLRKTEIPLRMAMGKNRASAIAAYAKGAERIAAHLDAGHDVGVLCEGDPLLFGSFIYLMEILEDRYPIAIVPGISSVMAGAAALKTPLTKGDESLAVLPASRPQEDIARALRSADTVVLLKAGKHLSKIAMVLERLGLADKARYVEHVGWESQQVRPFAEAAAEGGPYFSLVVVRP